VLKNYAGTVESKALFHLGNNLCKRRVRCSRPDLNQHLRFAGRNQRCPEIGALPLELPPLELLCEAFPYILWLYRI
jgi:hypothetical protein